MAVGSHDISDLGGYSSARLIGYSDYLLQATQQTRRRMIAGWSRAYSRQNQLLPYAGTCLSPGTVLRLSNYLDEQLRAEPRRNELGGAALLSSVLTTGRNAQTLARVRLSASDAIPTEPALVMGEHWTWWLPPGEPSSPQLPDPSIPVQTISRPVLIPLPCTDRTRRLIERCMLTPAHSFLASALRLSNPSMNLRAAARQAAISASLSELQNWLFYRIASQEMGDVAVAAMITGHVPPIAQTAIHYTHMETAEIHAQLTQALVGFDTIPTSPPLPPLDLGSRYAPSMDQLHRLTSRLAAPLQRPARHKRRDWVETHNAITLHTCLMGLFAAGFRPVARLIPSSRGIDPVTGFLIIDDKPLADNFKSRLLWMPTALREQLAHYEAHLEILRSKIAIAADPIPFLIEPSHAQIRLTPRIIRSVVRDALGYSRANAGRHFLRTQLRGKLSSEVLNALLGHWLAGEEPWGEKSGLDPLAYRRELSLHLDPLIQKAGWEPLRGL